MKKTKLVLISTPLILSILLILYCAIVYVNWISDRQQALSVLSEYKRLIDRTEEISKGYKYSFSGMDLSPKVVEIPTRIYDRNNEIIGEFFREKREIVPFEYFPRALIKGVIASEDRNFYHHNGINIKGIIRAMAVNVINLSVVQGGSTITQQLAKVLFTDMERSFQRKIYETFCAVEIEKRYDKQDILSMYLNLIYFGNGAYGVESASKMFFGMPVSKLNEAECSMIVAVISSPRYYSPLSNLEKSLLKTRRILKSMSDAGFISSDNAERQYSEFLIKWQIQRNTENRPLSSSLGTFTASNFRINRAPFFNESVRRMLVKKFDEELIQSGGLKIYTTIDAGLQDAALSALKSRLSEIRFEKQDSALNKDIDGAFISIDPYSGMIIAYCGGYEFSSASQLDNVSQIYRQPGSSIKPLLYAAAVERRDINPSTMFNDEKTIFPGGYEPKNYGDKYYGAVTAREALVKSLNIPAVKILEKTGYDKLMFVLKEGLNLPEKEFNSRFKKTLSLALGSYEISPLENAVLQSMIINGGLFIKPYGIKQIRDYNNRVIWDNEAEIAEYVAEHRRHIGSIIDPRAAAVTLSMLKGVLESGGTAGGVLSGLDVNFDVAGKTGTSSNYVDAWFIAYTLDSVTSVWIGNVKGAIPINLSGSKAALPVWLQYISKTHSERYTGEKFRYPDEGLSVEYICADSGKVSLKNNKCPRSVVQLFYSGTEPGEYCNLHEEK